MSTAPNEVRVETSITGLTGLPDGLKTTATVFLPDAERLASRAVVAFAFPGAGYSRGYFPGRLPLTGFDDRQVRLLRFA